MVVYLRAVYMCMLAECVRGVCACWWSVQCMVYLQFKWHLSAAPVGASLRLEKTCGHLQYVPSFPQGVNHGWAKSADIDF